MSSRIEIGSSPACDICISDAGVAEVHAVMYLSDDMLCMELLPNRAAVLNGNEVNGKYWLRSGDEVWIGQTRLDVNQIFNQLGGVPNEAFVMTDENSDAVVVRKNWWPFFWIVLILLAVLLAFYPKYRDYMREKAEQEKEIYRQDSIRLEQQRKLYELEKKKDSVERRLDSLNSYQ